MEANWAPTLEAAFGQHWQHTAGSEVGAMLKVGRQQPSGPVGTSDMSAQHRATNHMLSNQNHQPVSNGSLEYASSPDAFRKPEAELGFVSALGDQPAAAQPNCSSMDEWADIFDQCKTAMNGTGQNQAARVPHDQLPIFNVAMTPHLYVPPGGSMTFESTKSIDSEDVEDCMFGSDEDEPDMRGVKVTGLFKSNMDDWSRRPAQVQPLHLCTCAVHL